MRLLTKALLLLAAAAAFAISYEGAYRLQSAQPAGFAPAAMNHPSDAGQDFVLPNGSWETLFNASWR
jgi:hypothetical protein